MTSEKADITPACKYTNSDGEVLILKCVAANGEAYGGFMWPLNVGANVEAPDWNDLAECGGGLHGWPWGLAMGDGKDPDWTGAWIVFGAKTEDVVDLNGKCKAKRGTIRFVGDWQKATEFVLSGQIAWVHQASMGAASATGTSGAASATGDSGAASATGIDGKAQAGRWGCIALCWWNEKRQRYEMRCKEVGDGTQKNKLKPHAWYRLDNAGKFVEIEGQR